MGHTRILELMNRKLSGEASPEELRELQALLAEDPAAAGRQQVLEQFWARTEDDSHSSVEENLAKVLTGLGLTAPHPQARIKLINRRWMAAAAVLLIAAAGAILYNRQRLSADAGNVLAAYVEKHNAKGTRSIIQLTDGSKIWLNADSKIKYPDLFKGNTRDVYLNGEAFFDVAKNPEHPFIIHLAKGTVRVLGTSFNVRAYDSEGTVETSVTTGRVAFIPAYRSPGKKNDTVYLAPDQKARYIFSQEKLTTLPTAAQEDRAWTEGRLIFHAATMEMIAAELERNFGKTVVFLDEGPKQFVFTGSFGNNTLEEIMYYLARTKQFNYKITGNELLIAVSADRLP